MSPIRDLMQSDLKIANLGLPSFCGDLEAAGVSVISIDWSPPLAGDADAGWSLANMMPGDDIGDAIDAANKVAHERVLGAQPMWLDCLPARDALVGMTNRTILHSGPPVAWEDMAGPMQGAIIGAILFEGLAPDGAAARNMCEQGAIEFSPCHHLNAVGPMAGVISASMPVLVIEDANGGNRAFSNLNEGLGKALRFGAYGDEVLTRLGWMRDVLGPALSVIARSLGGVNLNSITAQALQMGDECHNRNHAATSLLFREIVPALVRSDLPKDQIADVLDFIAGNNHFYLNFSMAAAKVALMAGANVPNSSLVTVMARNGVEFGIQMSSTGNQWFTGPAQMVKGLYFPGYGEDHAAPDLGDSAITEAMGIGGFAMAAAPAIVQFVGGTPDTAKQYTRKMYEITLGRNTTYSLPPMGFIGTPTGIDVRLVADKNILPIINTGIAHKDAGVGQIGAGLVSPPIECFASALAALANQFAAAK